MRTERDRLLNKRTIQGQAQGRGAAERLRISEARFRALFENVIDGVYQTTPKGKLLTANPALVHMLGYSSQKEFLNINVSRDLYIYPEEREALIRRLNEDGELRNVELKLKRKDGKQITVLENAHAVRNARGRILYYEGILTDITERKRSEEALSALNYYGYKLNAARDVQQVYELTLDTAEQTLGFEYAAFFIVEKDKLRIVCQRGYPETMFIELPLDGTKRGITLKAAKTHKPILVPNVKKDEDYYEGIQGILSELAVPVETENKFIGVLDVESKQSNSFNEKDATLLQILAWHSATAISNLTKRAEIEKSSNQLASLMKSSAEMMRTMDLRQRLEKVAEAVTELGWRRVVIRVTDNNMEPQNLNDLVTAGLTNEERQYLWVNRPPGQVWRERFGQDYKRFKVGEFYHLPWSDPWVRKKFSEGVIPSKLSQTEMIDWDPQDLLYAPLRLADGRIVGLLSIDDPVDGKRPTQESLAPLELFLHQAAVAIENARLIQQLDNAKTQIEEYAEHLEEKVEERTREVKEAQIQLVRSERLAAVGQVAAMVGHDLRNPLTGISAAAYYVKAKLDQKTNERTIEMLELIEKNVQYANKIISDLMEYSIEIRLETTETDPKSVIGEALSLVQTPKHIKVVDATQHEPKIEVDMEKIKRTFINIIKNAFEAMPTAGTLTVKSQRSGDDVEIAFTDTGTGMTQDVIEKLWTPFLTTKAKGMGLGLPVCKRIVEAHGGKISAKSSVGKGTTFTVTIPSRQKTEENQQMLVNTTNCLLTTINRQNQDSKRTQRIEFREIK